jgi:hypothetical protein
MDHSLLLVKSGTINGAPHPQIMNFVKNVFVIGRGREPASIGMPCAVGPFEQYWLRRVAGETPRRIYPEDGVLPERHQLGDNDVAGWPHYNKRPLDPWSLVYDVALVGIDSGADYIFSTWTETGRRAVMDLAQAIHTQRKVKGAVGTPIIELRSGVYRSQWGDIAVPEFPIVGWLDEDKPLALPPV